MGRPAQTGIAGANAGNDDQAGGRPGVPWGSSKRHLVKVFLGLRRRRRRPAGVDVREDGGKALVLLDVLCVVLM
jgi:hypothetical protein